MQPQTVTTVTHDDDDTVVVTDEETYETHYGLRDPMLDVLHRSYLHDWTMKGSHARFVTYTEHTAKCKTTTITKWLSSTFYRWKLGYSKQAVTQKLTRQGEYIHRVVSQTGSGRHPSNQDETGSVLRFR